MKTLKQIRIFGKEDYQRYLKDFFEEPLSFESFINFQLAQLHDNECHVVSVHFLDTETVGVVFHEKI